MPDVLKGQKPHGGGLWSLDRNRVACRGVLPFVFFAILQSKDISEFPPSDPCCALS